MIKYALSAAFVATSLLLAACEKTDEATPEKTGSAAPGQVTPAGQPAGTAGEGQVTEAEAKLIADAEALQTKIDELQQQANNKTDETQAELVERLNALKQERDELKQQVDEFSDTGAAVVANVINGINNSLSIVGRSVEMEPEDDMPVPETTTPTDAPNP